MIGRVVVVLTVLWCSPVMAVGVDEQTLPPTQEAVARSIMKELRCLVCQNQSIEDSDADLARDLRSIVRERVAAGDDEAGVKSYLTERYGDWILLQPPFNARMAVLWLAPFLIIGLAAFLLWRRARFKTGMPDMAPAPLTADEQAALDRLLDKDQRG